MGNIQLKNESNIQLRSFQKIKKQDKFQKFIEFKKINPKNCDNEEFFFEEIIEQEPTAQISNNKSNRSKNRFGNKTSKVSFQSMESINKMQKQHLRNLRNTFSLRSFAKGSRQSVKVKWNQFIKIKKRNFFMDYQVVYDIGEGNYGQVYKVKSMHTDVYRAAKKIYKNKLTQDLQEKLMEEISTLMNLDHPNINKILQVYEHSDCYIILMELCQGGQLFNKILAKNLTQKSASIIIKQILRALVYIHSKGIIHRDIKPQNMLFQKGANLVKIIDFGIAAIKKQPNTRLTQRVGTPYYIAPQVLCKNYDEKCDVWSCGIILYMIIFGQPPFIGANEVEIMKNILKSPIKYQGPAWKKYSKQCQDFIQKLLEKDATKRLSAIEALRHPWLINVSNVYDNNELQYDHIDNIYKFHFKNKLQAVVLTYIVSQVLNTNQKLPLLKAFEQADENCDGMLSFQEVKNLLKSRNPEEYKSYKIQQIDNLLKSIDLNNNGQIDYTQFLVANLKKQNIMNIQNCCKAFAYFDIDHSGGITFAEILRFLEQNQNQTISDLRKMFEKGDQNNDGEICLKQFLKLTLIK